MKQNIYNIQEHLHYTWSVIKDTLQKKHHCKTTDKFVLNNHVVTDFDEIANELNIYYINISKSRSDQILSVASNQDNLLQHNNSNILFYFIPVSEVYNY